MVGIGAKSVDSVTAKLAKMVEDLHKVAAEQAERKAQAEAKIEAARAESSAAWAEGSRAYSIAAKIQQLIS